MRKIFYEAGDSVKIVGKHSRLQLYFAVNSENIQILYDSKLIQH